MSLPPPTTKGVMPLAFSLAASESISAYVFGGAEMFALANRLLL